MTTIEYHGDHFDFNYRVIEDGMWIASVMSYGDGERVLQSRSHPCPLCGDLTAADICAACSEDRAIDAPLDVDFAVFGF